MFLTLLCCLQHFTISYPGDCQLPPCPPPQIALNDSKSSLGDVFQHSLPKYAKQTIFTSNHVSWGVRYTPWTRSLCQKVFWRRSSAATGTFLMKLRSKSQNLSLSKKREILRFWASFHQKSAHSCRGTFSKYFLTLETRSGGINDLSTNVLWREDVLFCVFWKRKLKDTSQATFWRFSGGIVENHPFENSKWHTQKSFHVVFFLVFFFTVFSQVHNGPRRFWTCTTWPSFMVYMDTKKKVKEILSKGPKNVKILMVFTFLRLWKKLFLTLNEIFASSKLKNRVWEKPFGK